MSLLLMVICLHVTLSLPYAPARTHALLFLLLLSFGFFLFVGDLLPCFLLMLQNVGIQVFLLT